MASKIRASPHWLQRARKTLQRWILKRSPQVSEDLLEWQNILDTWPLEDILTLLTSPGEEPDRLRKSSPFCGILSEEEREKV